MYAIMGATGHTGGAAANDLLALGKAVRVVGRNPEKLALLQNKGAEVLIADVEDSQGLSYAFTGCEAAYVLIPPKMMPSGFRAYQNKVADAIVWALRDSNVKYVVTLSSLGADMPEKNGPVGGLYDLEKKLNAVEGVNVLHLRPPFFMENMLSTIGLIKMMGINGGAVGPDLAVPMVASADVGHYAAKRLAALDFAGKSVAEVQGYGEISYRELTRLIGAAIGKPDLQYVQFSHEDAVNGMTQMGLPREMAESFTELSRAANEGLLKYREPRSAANTTPTSFAEFIRTIYAPAYQKS